MAADPRIEMFSYYRDAELHGANLLLRLIKLMDDPDAQVKLSLHVAEETNHAWLWTKRITDLLAITKLLTVFETFESESDAVKSFSASAKV